MVNKCKTHFHKQVLSAWIKIFCTEPESDTINQFLVYNKSRWGNNCFECRLYMLNLSTFHSNVVCVCLFRDGSHKS